MEDLSYTLPNDQIIEMVHLAQEQGYTTDEALKLLAKHHLISDSDDDMD